MSAARASAVFLTWLALAFICVSLVTIYGFDYYEGALGSRLDNVMLGAVVNTLIAFVITMGFWTTLRFRGPGHLPFHAMHLLAAAAIACALLHLAALAGPFVSKQFGSWELNLGLLAVYSFLVGAFTALALMRITNSRQHAA